MGDCLNGKMPADTHTTPATVRPAMGIFSRAVPSPAPALPIARAPGYSF